MWEKNCLTSATLSEGQFLRHLHAWKALLAPGHVECDGVQELRGHEAVDALGGELLLLNQMQLVVADVVQAKAVRTDAIVSCKAGDVNGYNYVGYGRRSCAVACPPAMRWRKGVMFHFSRFTPAN